MNINKHAYIPFCLGLIGIAMASCGALKKGKNTVTNQPVVVETAPVKELIKEIPEIVSTPDQLARKKWQLVWLKGIDVAMVNYRNGKPYAVFDIEKRAISGHTGCNAFGGSMEVAGNHLKVGMLYCTKKFCLGIPEPEFLHTLEQCNKYEVVADTLRLFNRSDLIIRMISSN